MASLTVTPLPKESPKGPPDHWFGNPPTRFQNPWPSFRHEISLTKILNTRFGSSRNFVPVPDDRKGLVAIQVPDWGAGHQGTKATWIGHSSFLIETMVGSRLPENRPETALQNGTAQPVPGVDVEPAPWTTASDTTLDAAPTGAPTQLPRGVRFLMDPVFSERMGPRSLVGPKRFTRTPCALDDMPLVDAICISHNHYDHLDVDVIKHLYADKSRKRAATGMAPLQVFCGLGSKPWFVRCGVRPEHVTEMDWWDEVEVAVSGVGSVHLACTPSQHGSRRGPRDLDQMLWCSFVLRASENRNADVTAAIFFAGDTGYRSVTEDDVAAGTPVEDLPHCPAFAEIGMHYGPFDLALLPIGCYSPRTFMSGVHCSPEDAVEIHVDVRSRLSIGMHYGTVRGGISSQYEDVREPPVQWRAAGEKRGLKWNKDFRVCDIGETIII